MATNNNADIQPTRAKWKPKVQPVTTSALCNSAASANRRQNLRLVSVVCSKILLCSKPKPNDV